MFEGSILGLISLFNSQPSNSAIASPFLVNFGILFLITPISELSSIATSFHIPENVRATTPDFLVLTEKFSDEGVFAMVVDETESYKMSKY